ncbi:hypothetical protein, partial [Pseudoalteromonas sp. Of11M-6]|uniref:hypothetical protein n=1 Tax=Pseudoalteromonas sp. Of11M-6 TaxID=2917754 RepID=UPI001EF64772
LSWESIALTRRGSLVQVQYNPPLYFLDRVVDAKHRTKAKVTALNPLHHFTFRTVVITYHILKQHIKLNKLKPAIKSIETTSFLSFTN